MFFEGPSFFFFIPSLSLPESGSHRRTGRRLLFPASPRSRSLVSLRDLCRRARAREKKSGSGGRGRGRERERKKKRRVSKKFTTLPCCLRFPYLFLQPPASSPWPPSPPSSPSRSAASVPRARLPSSPWPRSPPSTYLKCARARVGAEMR